MLDDPKGFRVGKEARFHLIHHVSEGHLIFGITESYTPSRSRLAKRAKRRAKKTSNFSASNQRILHESNAEGGIDSQDLIQSCTLHPCDLIDFFIRKEPV